MDATNRAESDQLSMAAIKVFIVDDHVLARGAIRNLLELAPDIEVVGEAANGQEAVELLRRVQCDLVLMDIDMPVMNGFAATRAIKQRNPDTKVLMLTAHDDEAYLSNSLDVGAAGYLTKSAPASEMHQAVREVVSGSAHIDWGLLAKLGDRITRLSRVTRQTLSFKVVALLVTLVVTLMILLVYLSTNFMDDSKNGGQGPSQSETSQSSNR